MATAYAPGKRFNADDNRWESAKQIIGSERVTLGSQASQQWLQAPEHLAMVLARYRAAASLIGSASTVVELGCGEGIGARILDRGRFWYLGIDTDAESVLVAQMQAGPQRSFHVEDILDVSVMPSGVADAAVSLDVIEHIPAEHESAFMDGIVSRLTRLGVCVIGTPNAAFDHLASPQSKAGHVNTYTHERLHALMAKHFAIVQSFGMQDTALHLGHPDARHYLLMAGIGLRVVGG
jgi:2-polyprenyl-3-methyl-5-hydroxy-6-metoxy-1,4-benzoquinol methylase